MTGVGLLAGSGMPWLLALAVIGGSITALIKAWSVLRKVELDASGARERVRSDADAARERLRSDGDNIMLTQALARIAALELRISQLETDLADERAARGIVEHQLAQESHGLDNLIMMAKARPDRLVEIIPQIEENRERGKQRIAMEKGALAGARGTRQ